VSGRHRAPAVAAGAPLRATAFKPPSPPEAAPWYAIPADHKWMARTEVAQIVVHHLELMDPRYREPDEAARRAAAEAVRLLLDEG
jgi:polyphosphate kinase 2 PPK2